MAAENRPGSEIQYLKMAENTEQNYIGDFEGLGNSEDNMAFRTEEYENKENEQDGRTNLIINYLPQFTGEQELANIFMGIGDLEHVRVMKDLKAGFSYGYGFVKFKYPEDAAEAILHLNGMEYFNKRLKVSYARPPSEDIKNCNLYITNLPKTISDEEFIKLFGEFGEILQSNLLKNKSNGLPRGVGFVRYAHRTDAEKAMLAMHGKTIEGSVSPISVRVAEEHSKLKSTYYDGWTKGRQMNAGSDVVHNPPKRAQPRNNQRGVSRRGRGKPYTSVAMGRMDFNFPFYNC